MITIDWTYSSIKTAAEVIFTINPNQHKSPQEVESYIKKQSEDYVKDSLKNGEDPTFIGTGGWFVTFFKSDSDDSTYETEVTLQPSVVRHYIELTDGIRIIHKHN